MTSSSLTPGLMAFLDLMPDPVFGANDGRTLVYANAAGHALFARDNLIGSRIDDLFVLDGGVAYDDVWPGFLATGTSRSRLMVRRPSGERRWMETSSVANVRPGLHISLVRDVTDHVLAERRLATQFAVAAVLARCSDIDAAAPAILREIGTVLSASWGAFWVADPGAGVLTCRGSWSNGDRAAAAHAAALLGRTIAPGSGLAGASAQSGAPVWGPDESTDVSSASGPARRVHAEACAFPVRSGRGVEAVIELSGRSLPPTEEAERDLEATSRQIRVFLEREQAERQLLITGRLAWHMPVGLVVLRLTEPGDPHSFRLVTANPAAERMTGIRFAPEGVPMLDLAPRLSESGLPELFLEVVTSGEPASALDVASVVESAPDARFDVRVVPLPTTSIGVLFEDVTERHLLEERLRAHTSNLETLVEERALEIKVLEVRGALAEKLAVVGRLAARVAHEIVNPLASIKNAFMLVKDGVPAAYQHAHYIPRIEREIERIASIVGEMRQLYRPVVESARPGDLVMLVRDAAAVLEGEARERSVELRVRASEQPLECRVQVDAVRQIVLNLVRNAMDASPTGGTVDITVAGTDEQLEVLVADEGPGVPADLGEQIFEPFYTTKSPAHGVSGLGLGLAIAQGLADEMRGHVDFIPAPGRGAAFRLTVPRFNPLPSRA